MSLVWVCVHHVVCEPQWLPRHSTGMPGRGTLVDRVVFMWQRAATVSDSCGRMVVNVTTFATGITTMK